MNVPPISLPARIAVMMSAPIIVGLFMQNENQQD